MIIDAGVELFAYDKYRRCLADNPDWLEYHLANNYKWQRRDEPAPTPAPAGIIRAGKTAAKAAAAVDAAQYDTEHAALYDYATIDDAQAAKTLTDTQRDIIDRIARAMSDHTGATYCQWLDEFTAAHTSAARKRITRAARALALCASSDMWRAIYGAFTVGEIVTPAEIKQRLQNVATTYYQHAGELAAWL